MIILGDTLYVPNPTRPFLRLNPVGDFPMGSREQLLHLTKEIKYKGNITINVSIGNKDGYNRKEKEVVLSAKSVSTLKISNILLQLIGLYFWFEVLDKKQRLAYANVIRDLPDSEDPMKDFATTFERFWKGEAKQPRRQLLHSFLVKMKGPFEPRDLPSQMGGPRNPRPERRNPIPSVPFTPNSDSQFH